MAVRRAVEPVRKFRAFGSQGIYDEGTTRAGVYFELLRRGRVPLTSGKLLDIGSGFGGFTIAAARGGAQVTAVDGDEYRLRMLRRRLLSETEEVQARISILETDAPELPIGDACFDQVLTIGVLEWVPLVSRQPGDPREVQLATLREIRRVLRPAGTYVLATKNRWYLPNVLHEPQTLWPIVNVLPRRLAQPFAQIMFGHAYRTYIYSLYGWQALLQEAGFGSVRVLVPVYGMHWPIGLLPPGSGGNEVSRAAAAADDWIPPEYLQRMEGTRPGLSRLAHVLLWRLGMEELLAQGFVFIATA